MTILSGVQPSGRLHLGNYFGAIKQHLELQTSSDQALYFIANYHSLTTMTDPALLQKHTIDIATDYMALGLNPNKAILFRQSDVPEVCELSWILSCCVGKGVLERSHAFKDKIAKGLDPSVGLFTYPVLMAADILIYRSTLIPVGRDQVQHVEMAQDIASSFNYRYKTKVLVHPEMRLSEAPVVPGIDGRKMSKSYENSIPIFPDKDMTEKQIWKTYFASIVTDCKTVDDPKDPNDTLMTLYRLLDPLESTDFQTSYVRGGIGYGDLKKRVFSAYLTMFGEAHERRHSISDNTIRDILLDGGTKARTIAQNTMSLIKTATGIA